MREQTTTHPRLNPGDQPAHPDRSARELGYHMPAEFEPQAAVWLTPPHNPDTWPGCLEAAQCQFTRLIALMRPYVQPRTTQGLGIPTNDSWIRDYGPLFVTDDRGGLACHDFRFNCWGGKYEPYADDDLVPQRIAHHLGVPVWVHDLVLEGGSIEVNGRGTVMTTRQCLLNPNRNPHLNAARIEHVLHEALGTSHVIWLEGGIRGDDTDGHIDDVARFVRPDTVVAVRADNQPGHPDAMVLEQNWCLLERARDQQDQPLNLVPLPVPEVIEYVYPPEPGFGGSPKPLPASYANFLITNGAVLVPIFGQRTDDLALRRLEQTLPEHDIIPVPAEHLVVGLGGIHCLTQPQPPGPRKYPRQP